VADQIHGWLGAVVSVGFAWAGFGAMSLAIGQVAGALAGGTLIIIFSPMPLRLGFDAAKARKLLKFGVPLAGSSFVVFLVGNVDNLVAGHLLGATILGFYVLAWNLASWPVSMFSQPVRSVAPALFSRLQHDPAAMRSGFASAAGLLGAVTLPVCLLISGSAVPLISFVYGARWAPAAQALVWLALLGALRILFELTYDYFVVLAHSRAVLTIQLAWLLALTPALIAGARLAGIRGVAIAGVAVAAFVVLPWYLRELSKVGIRRRVLAARLWLPFTVAAGVGAGADAAARAIPNDFAACAAGGVAALIAIALLLHRMRPTLKALRTALSKHDSPQPAEALTHATTAVAPPSQSAA
jgi:O-antigen/teichoic acid export membrane protein